MTELDHTAKLHVQAAEGWLELGNHVEANVELDQIPPEFRAHPKVLMARWNVYANTRQWGPALDIAERMMNSAPNLPAGWIHRSFALHELKRTQEAYVLLLEVADRFSKSWMIPYNLACYCAQLGRMAECKTWFERAMKIDAPKTGLAAVEDPDLKPFLDSMGGRLGNLEG
jgi:predicted Zn-dependent protease